MKVAIQGGPASFHDIAAHNYFGNGVTTISCLTFRDVCDKLKSGKADLALMAIENSIVGSILTNYSLLEEYKLYIIGEYKLRIKQNLMAIPGQSVDDIKIVRSHYMALGQCEEFFSAHHHMILVETDDTANSARDIAKAQEMGVGAIAGIYAAKLYNLEILSEGIETIKSNYTRFFVLSRNKEYGEKRTNKATLGFVLPHKVGSLAESLKVVVDCELNLTKIQSVPIIGKPDQYTFYIDCMWDSYEQMQRCYLKIKSLILNLNVLGEYKSWELDYDNTIS